jgi:hypothetical protein
MEKITVYVTNSYRHMNIKLQALYRSILFMYEVAAEETGNMIMLNGHWKKPVTVAETVSIYRKPPEK